MSRSMQMSDRHKMGRSIVVSDHAHMRCRQRGIDIDELRKLLHRVLDGPILPGVYRKRFATLTVVYEQTCDYLRVITVYQARKKKVKRVTEVAEHLEHRTLKDFLIDPDHAKREGESAEFDHAVKRLKADGHYRCRVCLATDNLQVHHFGCEWMFENIVDFDKLKAYVEEHDIYGYSRLLRNQPITTVDDIRNLEVLCQPHHTGVDHQDDNSGVGVHDLTEPTFNIQIVCLDGADPVPQPGETFSQTMERIKQFERR